MLLLHPVRSQGAAITRGMPRDRPSHVTGEQKTEGQWSQGAEARPNSRLASETPVLEVASRLRHASDPLLSSPSPLTYSPRMNPGDSSFSGCLTGIPPRALPDSPSVLLVFLAHYTTILVEILTSPHE